MRAMEQDFAKRRVRTPLAEPSPVSQPSSLGLLLTGLITGIALGLFVALLIYLSGALPPAPGQAPVADTRQIDTQSVSTATGNPGVVTAEQQREAQRLQLEFYQELPNYEVVVDVTPVSGSTPRTPVAVSAGTAVNSQQPSAAIGDSETTDALSTEADIAIAVTESATAGDAPEADSTAELDPVSAALLEISNRAAANTSTPAMPAAGSGANFMLQAGAFQQQTTANAQLNRLLGLGLNARVHQENLPGRTLYLVQAGPYASRDEMMQAERVLRSNSIDSMRITLSQP
jgi:cell division protein FtsN